MALAQQHGGPSAHGSLICIMVRGPFILGLPGLEETINPATTGTVGYMYILDYFGLEVVWISEIILNTSINNINYTLFVLLALALASMQYNNKIHDYNLQAFVRSG